jgi:hypothetical protein
MRYDLGRAEKAGPQHQRILDLAPDGGISTMRAFGPFQFSRVSLLVVALLLLVGCSLSASSDSSSESSGSSSASSESKETQYRNDVRDFTAAYVKSGGRLEDFKRRLGDLAKERGITDWEENMATYEGIGRGLGKAKVTPVELDTYTTNLTGSDAKKAKAIKDGFDAEKE